ncbi:MAG: hypothetical protein AAGA33_06945 [Pseudomonadota bacterium]
MRFLPLLALWLPGLLLAEADMRRESCLLGQDTATLYYELLTKRPEKADEIRAQVATRIDRRAYYWAMVYVEHGKSYEELEDTYMMVCMKTGPLRIPAPQIP